MATDRLSLANALEAANIDRPAAERIATEIYDAIDNNSRPSRICRKLAHEDAARKLPEGSLKVGLHV